MPDVDFTFTSSAHFIWSFWDFDAFWIIVGFMSYFKCSCCELLVKCVIR